MRHLAKAGFSQSYSYFTWRNTKAGDEEYFTELTRRPVRDYMRPNLFANTPDILHEYLQTRRPPGVPGAPGPRGDARRQLRHLQRLRAVRERAGPRRQRGIPRLGEVPDPPARLRPPPTASRSSIARVNAIRREHPALQFDRGARVPRDRQPEHLICYSKRAPDGERSRSWSSSTSIPPTCSTATSGCRWPTGSRADATCRGARPALGRDATRGAANGTTCASIRSTRVAHIVRSRLAQSPIWHSVESTDELIRSGTRTPSSTRRTSAPSSTATTTASATSPA